MSRSALSRWVSFALVVLFLLGHNVSFTRAQNAQPASTPEVAPPPQPTPTPTALPSATPGVAATPSPASLPSIVPQAPTAVRPINPAPSVGFTDPNIILAPPPLLVPTPTPLPLPTETPISIPESGVVVGEEPPSDAPFLDAPGGVVYDADRGLALAQGEVTLGYGNFRAKGQRGVVNEKTGDATLTGDLTIYAQQGGRTQVFTGKTLLFNIKTGKWVLSQIEATFPPELFPRGTVLAPLYETNGTVRGQDDNALGENFRFTSCDREHYYLRSNRINFYRTPNGTPSRIVLRRNALYLFHRKILPLPVYSISLLGQTSRRQPLQTTFGQNSIDGFFAKTIYNIGATSKLTDSLLIDALSKRGLGLGFQRQLIGGGLLYLYSVTGKTGGREVNARVNKNYQITRLISSSINLDSTQNNSVAGSGIASRIGNFSLSRAGERAQTTLNYSQNLSSYSNTGVTAINSTSRTDSLLLNHQQNFGRGYLLSVSSALNQSQFGVTGSDDTINQTGDLDILFTKGSDTDVFDISLHTELHNDFRRGNAAYQLERLPELLLSTNTNRLLSQDSLINKRIPGTFSLGLGTFNEPSNSFGGTTYGGRKSRADFVYNLQGQELRLLGRGLNTSVPITTDPLVNQDPLNVGVSIPVVSRAPSGVTITPSAYFEQAFYTGDTARYNYAYGVNNTNTLGPIQLSLGYNKQRTEGFTPFQFDLYTPSENVYYTASYIPSRRFSLNLSGSRDIQNSYTNDAIANLQWIPARGTSVTLATTYGFQGERRGLFGDVVGNLIFSNRRNNNQLLGTPQQTPGTQFSLGFRYSPSGTGTNRGLTRVNASLNTTITSKFLLQAFAGYDGVNKRFDFQQYRAVVDLHCFNLYATYDGSRNELRFDLALKAFPFADTRFGRNRFSEGFDPSVGGIQ